MKYLILVSSLFFNYLLGIENVFTNHFINANIEDKTYSFCITVDDEDLVRKSNVRVISKALKNNPLSNNKNWIIFEAKDGFDCLYLIYYITCVCGKKLSFVVMDETMSYMSGSQCSKLIQSFVKEKIFKNVKIAVLSAYLKDELVGRYQGSEVESFYSKPLKASYIDKILCDI